MSVGFAGLLKGRLFSRQMLLYWLAGLIFIFILIIHLGSLPGGLSPAEHSAVDHNGSINSIYKNPLNAPHDLLSFGFKKISQGFFSARFSSVVWGIIFAASFLKIAKTMFGGTIGLIGTIIFSFTPYFLVSARQATPDIMFAAPVLVMGAYILLSRQTTDRTKTFPLLVILSALTLYVPGMLWWFLGAGFAGRKKLTEAISIIPKPQLYLSLAAGVAVLIPLLLALGADWQLIKPLALIPSHFSAPMKELKDIGWMASAWFFKTPFHSPLIIGRIPIFNIVLDVLLVFGTYALFQAAKNKALALLTAIIFATVAAGINNNLSILLLGLPSAGILITAGLRYLYVEWRGVFPRNPAAKYLAIILIAVLGLVQLLYGLRYSLIAWPHSLATRETYVIK